MIIHLFKKLFSKKYRNELRRKEQDLIELQLDQIFLKLSEMYPQQNHCHTYIDLPLGVYQVDGSWLHDNFYLDIHKKDKRLGRIYIDHGLFMDQPPVRWSALTAPPNNKRVFETYSHELTANDLAHAINSIVPKLVLTWLHKGERMISVDVTITDISSALKLPEKE